MKGKSEKRARNLAPNLTDAHTREGDSDYAFSSERRRGDDAKKP